MTEIKNTGNLAIVECFICHKEHEGQLVAASGDLMTWSAC